MEGVPLKLKGVLLLHLWYFCLPGRWARVMKFEWTKKSKALNIAEENVAFIHTYITPKSKC